MPAEVSCADAAFIARYDGRGFFPHLVRLLARRRTSSFRPMARSTSTRRDRHLRADPGRPRRGLRTFVCDHGHFFAAAGHAQSWRDEHADGRLLSVADAFDAACATCETLGWVTQQVRNQ